MTGTQDGRDGGPVGSDPAAATEEECALHGYESTCCDRSDTKGKSAEFFDCSARGLQ